jgi:hypothetical protein
MTVAYELTCSGTSRSYTETINEVVQTALKELEEDLTGNTFLT